MNPRQDRQRTPKITRRQAIAAAGAGLLASSCGTSTSAAKPNILFIMADDLGYADVSCYGRREYKTPNIDRLAKEGMQFFQAYANSSVCSATRTALITGRYQYRLPIGLEEPLGGPARGVGIPADHPTLPSLLKKAGYGTTLLGKWHLGYMPKYSPTFVGYDHFWGFHGGGIDYFTHKSGASNTATDDLWEQTQQVHETGYMTELLGNHAVQVLGDYAKQAQPFLLSLHFNAPHWPWEGPDDEKLSERPRPITDYDGGTLKIFGTMVVEMDRQIGRVLNELDRLGLADNTIVIFTSDNGGERFSDTWPFSGKKTELLEGGLRIPLLVRWPGHIQAGSKSQQVAMTMDWLPTLTAVAGVGPDAAYPSDGMDLMPALRGGTPVARKVYWRYRYNRQRAMRDGDMKWLQIGENSWLFNAVDDPLEKANKSNLDRATFDRMAAEYAAWNAGMLPEDNMANSAGLTAPQNPDRPHNPPRDVPSELFSETKQPSK